MCGGVEVSFNYTVDILTCKLLHRLHPIPLQKEAVPTQIYMYTIKMGWMKDNSH